MKAMKMKNKILELSKRKGNIYKLTIGKRIFYGIDEVLLTSPNLSFKLEDKQFVQGDASQLEEDVKSYYRPIKLLYTKVFIKNKETEVLLLKTEENDIICIDRQYLDYFDQSALFKIGGIDRPIEVLENGLFVGLVNHKIKDRDEIVKDLINKCDYILVPRLYSIKKNEGVCTNFNALYDLVNNTFDNINTINYNVDLTKKENELLGFLNLGKDLGFSYINSYTAYKFAKEKSLEKENEELKAKIKKLEEVNKKAKKQDDKKEEVNKKAE